MFRPSLEKRGTKVQSLNLKVGVVLSILISMAHSKIHIWEPKSLQAMYAHADIPYSVMNFGTIPYGHSIYGTVFKASPYNSCSELSPLKWDKNYGTLIMLVERGGCNFSEKVLNAQKIGAGLVLIADNTNEDVHKIFPVERTKEMLDKVHIASALISKAEADNFLSAMEAPNNNSNPHGGSHGIVELAMHFDLTKVHGLANIKIILQVDDYRSYDLIQDFFEIYSNFHKHLNLKIHFKIFLNADFYFSDDDCIKVNNDKFCVGKSFGDEKKNLGLPIETMRQLCLKNFDIIQYLSYAKAIRNTCFDANRQVVDDFKECTSNVYNSVVKTATRNKIEKCITPDDPENSKALKGNHDEVKYLLINYSPLIFINGFYYKGNFDDLNHLFETICNSFEVPPTECNSLTNFANASDMNSVSLVRFITISIGFCISTVIVAVILFYIIYKKKIKKRFNFELNDKINEALAKFYSEEDDQSNNESSYKENNNEETKGTESDDN
jgi:hypothetical protein